MKKISIIILLALAVVGCKNSINIKDTVQSTLFFSQADTLREFSGNGSFVVIGDTVLLSDYYYDYNDDHAVSMFKLNTKGITRILDHQNNCSAELDVYDGRLQVFRRCYNSTYEELCFRDISSKSSPNVKRLQFAHTDHVVKAGRYFVGADILGTPNMLNLYDSNGKFIQSIDPFDGVLDSLTEIGKKYTVGQGCLAYNSKKKFIVYATVYTGEIFIYDIYDDKLRLLYKIDIGNGLPDNFDNFEVTAQTFIYAKDICQDDNYIYVLVNDKKVIDNRKICYIIRVDKDGDIYCMKCPKTLLRIFVRGDRVFALSHEENDKNILVVAKNK